MATTATIAPSVTPTVGPATAAPDTAVHRQAQHAAPPCTAAVCTADCAQQPTDRASGLVQLGRMSALLLGLAAGVLLINAVALIPGRRRVRRASWALRRTCRWILVALGVRVVVQGAPRSGPSLVVGNHVSWLDIVALLAGDPMTMVAKAEVGRWPVVGRAAEAAGTVFLDRDRLRLLPATVEEMVAILRSGQRVQVFPEATTRCGTALTEFSRAAFQAAIDAAVVVSPFSIAYTSSGARTTGPAFLGADTLGTSLRRVLRMPTSTVTLTWLPAIPAIAGRRHPAANRAVLALAAQRAIARSLRVPVVPRPSAGS